MTTCFVTNHYFSKTCGAKMSVAKANKRKYKEDYIRYDGVSLQKDGEYIPQGYVVHENTG